ncbi:helix-turn-helix domain-containing protein [Verrucosispora sp. WMMD1129]|uniref:helix-turn-helix domain-containing protein n=1 Tax=Verrucosispora sp. WMMD1129 TaxID=3016093 RepID=UPI00249A84D8|nr:helix-turn-helix domain-containing protein [Verrucosispora sp. WMMD1129]WFE43323.1 helix-turn-helix domain-containing protein [Verrucosispora sp. WMMD1129]
MTGRSEVPIGRRVAQWRVRRRMTQQGLADRLGKSKSWVDKVERGARRLDKFSVIQAIAEVLRVDPAVLLGQPTPPAGVGVPDGLDEVRAALARYGVCQAAFPVSTAELRRQVGHAWLSFQHGQYAQVVRALPGLLDAVRMSSAFEHAESPVQAYRVASSVLVKLGEAALGWLAADRAVAAAGGDAVLTGTAAISIGQALRLAGRERLALAATVAAAQRLTTPRPSAGGAVSSGRRAQELAVGGTLLLQAALAAASCGEPGQAEALLGRAADLADQVEVAEQQRDVRVALADDPQRTSFGAVAVELTRVVVAVGRGDLGEALGRHELVIRREGWRRLPAEYRGAYLVDAARAYLLAGDLAGAGRMLVAADGVAPAEVRARPSTRTLLGELARGRPAPPGVARLATLVGLTR